MLAVLLSAALYFASFVSGQSTPAYSNIVILVVSPNSGLTGTTWIEYNLTRPLFPSEPFTSAQTDFNDTVGPFLANATNILNVASEVAGQPSPLLPATCYSNTNLTTLYSYISCIAPTNNWVSNSGNYVTCAGFYSYIGQIVNDLDFGYFGLYTCNSRVVNYGNAPMFSGC